MIQAPVNRIIPFSNVDGPGNRLALFLQTCPFACRYCHNPETIRSCIGCGTCVSACPVQALSLQDGHVVWDKTKCCGCDTCLRVCPHLATPKITWMTVEDVMAEIRRAKPFIKGITVSGGECMNHAAFLEELFKQARQLGLTCFIDSNGAHDFAAYPELMDVCDAVMLDVKAFDPEFHRWLTGQPNDIVLRNLDWLLDHHKMYEVRTVLLNGQPEQNETTVRACAARIQNRCRYKLIRYRPFGVRKSELENMGKQTLSEAELNRCVRIAKEYMEQVVTV